MDCFSAIVPAPHGSQESAPSKQYSWLLDPQTPHGGVTLWAILGSAETLDLASSPASPAWSAHVAALEQWQTPGRPDWLSPMRIHTFRFGLRHSAGRFSAATRAWPSFATFSARAFSTRIHRNILGTAWLKWKRPKPFQSTCQDEAFSRGSGVTGRSLHTALRAAWHVFGFIAPTLIGLSTYAYTHIHWSPRRYTPPFFWVVFWVEIEPRPAVWGKARHCQRMHPTRAQLILGTLIWTSCNWCLVGRLAEVKHSRALPLQQQSNDTLNHLLVLSRAQGVGNEESTRDGLWGSCPQAMRCKRGSSRARSAETATAGAACWLSRRPERSHQQS